MFVSRGKKFRKRRPNEAMIRRHVSSYVDLVGWRGWRRGKSSRRR